MCKESISNLSTFFMANTLKSTCHLWQLYHTIQHQEESRKITYFSFFTITKKYRLETSYHLWLLLCTLDLPCISSEKYCKVHSTLCRRPLLQSSLILQTIQTYCKLLSRVFMTFLTAFEQAFNAMWR